MHISYSIHSSNECSLQLWVWHLMIKCVSYSKSFVFRRIYCNHHASNWKDTENAFDAQLIGNKSNEAKKQKMYENRSSLLIACSMMWERYARRKWIGNKIDCTPHLKKDNIDRIMNYCWNWKHRNYSVELTNTLTLVFSCCFVVLCSLFYCSKSAILKIPAEKWKKDDIAAAEQRKTNDDLKFAVVFISDCGEQCRSLKLHLSTATLEWL